MNTKAQKTNNDDDQLSYKDAKDMLKSVLDKPIAYHHVFARDGGGAAAGIFLSQAWYWTPKGWQGGGWFYKTVEECEAETGLTYKEQQKARRELVKRGLIEEDKRGIPAKLHYRVVLPRVVELLTGAATYTPEISEGKKKRMENLNNGGSKVAERSSLKLVEKSKTMTHEDSTTKFDESSTNKGDEESANYYREYTENTSEISSESSSESTRYTAHPQNADAKVKDLSGGVLVENPSEEVSFRDTGGDTSGTDEAEAIVAMDAFESVGVTHFDVTIKDECTGDESEFHTHSVQELRDKLPHYLKANAIRPESFIVRPRGGALIQVDDLKETELDRIERLSFLTVETSAGNYQAWVALQQTDQALRDSIRRRLLRGMGADLGASGAMRMGGSINRKPSRNGFQVRVRGIAPNKTIAVSQLHDAGLLAPEQKEFKRTTSTMNGKPHKFPSYDKCLTAKEGDRSRADASFLAISRMRGFTREEAAAELEKVSERVEEELERGRGEEYLHRTAKSVYG